MRWIYKLPLRFRSLLRKTHVERELTDELRFHLEKLIEEKVASGMTPEEAHHAAMRELGGMEQIKEQCRDMRKVNYIEHFFQDVRYGRRMLAKNPGFTTVAVLTLALGIGANTAIFSVVNAVLLRPLPFPQPDRLVLLWATNQRTGETEDVSSYPDFLDWKVQSKSFDGMAAFTNRTLTLSAGNETELASGVRVAPGFFETLGVLPALGRTIHPGEEEAGASHVALLSDSFWKRRYGGRADILGQTIGVNEESYTIVGVIPQGFNISPNGPEQIYVPQVKDPDRGHGFLLIVGRLRPHVSISEAQAEMDLISRRLTEQYPKFDRDIGVNLEPLGDALVGRVRTGLLIFLGVVTLVLLIACTNVANLMLARSTARQKELAVRAAMGAGRGRLMQQLLTESTLLALAGGAVGLLLANWTAWGLVTILAKNFSIPRLGETHTDSSVLGFTLLLSLLTGILFGVVPAFSSASPDLNEHLREASRSMTGGVRGRRARGMLVITETALALVLLAGAGLLLKSLLVMRGTAPGFQTDNLLTVDFWLPQAKFEKTAQRLPFFTNLLAQVGALPGVRSAALVANLPLGGGQDGLSFHIPERPDPAPGKPFSSGFNIVSPGYFRTMEIPLRAGREFTEQDSANTPGVIVTNETAARRFWPGENPLGRQITLIDEKNTTVTFTVVGVTGDVRNLGLGKAPRPEMFLDYMQPTPAWPWLALVARTTAEPMKLASALKGVARSVDPHVPISHIRTMDDVLSATLAQPSVYTLLLGVFALLALALAMVGLYGVVSYTVSQRTHEMGIRIALGAGRGDILRLVLRQGLGLAMAGIAIGLIGALEVTRLLTHLIPGVKPGDPLTLSVVSALLLSVGLLASYIPARRAMRVDPTVALRWE